MRAQQRAVPTGWSAACRFGRAAARDGMPEAGLPEANSRASASPAPAPRLLSFPSANGVRAGVTQLVECQLPKLNVAGSSPVARSIRCPIGGEAAIGSVRRGRPLAAIGGRACGAARCAHRSRRVRSPGGWSLLSCDMAKP